MNKEDESKIRISADPALVANIHPFASATDGRQILGGIHFETAEPGGIYMIASDGRTMAIAHDASGQYEGPAGGVTMRVSGLLAAACRRKRRLDLLRMIARGRRLSIAPGFDWEHTDSELFVQAGNPIIESKYPDWRRIMPDFRTLQRGALSHSGGIQAAFIARLSSMGRGSFGNTVTFWQKPGDGNPIVVQQEAAPQVLVIIMPTRSSEGPLTLGAAEAFSKFRARA